MNKKINKIDKLSNFLKSYWIYLIIYFLFLYISSTSARAGDDWEVSNWYKSGFLSTFAGMIRLATYMNGRILTNLFVSFFAHHVLLWKLIAPLFFTSIIFLSSKIFGYEKKPFPAGLSLLLILSVSNGLRIETLVWLTGNVGYITVVALIFFYLYLIYNESTNRQTRLWKSETLNNLMIFLFAFIIGLWTENVTLAFTTGNLLLTIISYFKQKKITPFLKSGLTGSILSSVLLFGSLFTLEKNPDLNNGLVTNVIQKIPGVLQMLVIENLNIFLAFLILFSAWVFFGQHCIEQKKNKYLIMVLPLLSILLIVLKKSLEFILRKWYLPVGKLLGNINNLFFNTNNTTSIVFCFFILSLIMIAILFTKEKEKLFIIYSMSLISAFSMAGAPYLGARTFALSVFIIICITVYFASTIKVEEIKSCDLKKAIHITVTVLLMLQTEKYYINGEQVRKIENIRLQIMDYFRAGVATGVISTDEWLVLPSHDEDKVVAAANPCNDCFHMGPMLRYYDLPNDTKVVFDDGYAVKAITATQVSGRLYKFEVFPLYDKSYYRYTFYVKKDKKTVFKSPDLDDTVYYYEFSYEGDYTISCVLSRNGSKKEKFTPEIVKVE